jgi:hypothetical protein
LSAPPLLRRTSSVQFADAIAEFAGIASVGTSRLIAAFLSL